MTKPKRTTTSPELMKAFDIIAKLKPRKKPKDPLAAVKQKHTRPWRVALDVKKFSSRGWPWDTDWAMTYVVKDKNGGIIVVCRYEELARAIARMGNAA
jgi:hypothetical protein